jgi:RNA polymerase sigma-70 factor (ECF subfamily)
MSAEQLRLTVARARRGSPEAFRELVDAFKDRLFAFVWRILRDHHEAEDICQAVFVRAYERLGEYRDEYAFSTWLFTIAYRMCLNSLRKRRAYAGDLDLGQFDGGADEAAETVASSEEARRLRALIWKAVDQLSAAQKSAVLLFYREGKSCQEIGEVLGIPAVTVKSHLHRARARLRECLKAELADGQLACNLSAFRGA